MSDTKPAVFDWTIVRNERELRAFDKENYCYSATKAREFPCLVKPLIDGGEDCYGYVLYHSDLRGMIASLEFGGLVPVKPIVVQVSTESPMEFYATIRYRSGAYHARCCGCTASSTNSPEIAALAAAAKHWKKCTAIHDGQPDAFTITTSHANSTVIVVTYTRKLV